MGIEVATRVERDIRQSSQKAHEVRIYFSKSGLTTAVNLIKKRNERGLLEGVNLWLAASTNLLLRVSRNMVLIDPERYKGQNVKRGEI
ncbi:MAG: hypothetical protein ACF8AM_06655 [Rhodopirellula sp. JB055]|uniref:hypothetical protein n=1 Tax=Rhodopirellula sp. JB055 TaxID=3342846 RepID=UPI00370CDCED